MCLSRCNGCILPEEQQPAAQGCADVSADQAAAWRGGPGAARAQLPAAPVPPAQRAQRGRGGPAALPLERQHVVRGCTAPGSMAAGGALPGPSCGQRIAVLATSPDNLLCWDRPHSPSAMQDELSLSARPGRLLPDVVRPGRMSAGQTLQGYQALCKRSAAPLHTFHSKACPHMVSNLRQS